MKAGGCLVAVAQCTKVALLHYWAVFSLAANRGTEWYTILTTHPSTMRNVLINTWKLSIQCISVYIYSRVFGHNFHLITDCFVVCKMYTLR